MNKKKYSITDETLIKKVKPHFNIFTKHPNSINETYCEHLLYTLKCGTKLILYGFACILHGLIPFIFIDIVSKNIIKLAASFSQRKVFNNEENDKTFV